MGRRVFRSLVREPWGVLTAELLDTQGQGWPAPRPELLRGRRDAAGPDIDPDAAAKAASLASPLPPGCFPLGYSYALGQARLRFAQDGVWPSAGRFPAPRDPAWRRYIQQVCAGWTEPARLNFPRTDDEINATLNQISGQGPLPADAELDAVKGDALAWANWSPADRVTRERHVYFYEYRAAPMIGSITALAVYFDRTLADVWANNQTIADSGSWDASQWQIALNIYGWSETKQAWILPHAKGIDAARFFQTGRRGEWETDVSVNEWIGAKWTQVVAVVAVVLSIVATVLTFGGASAALVGAVAFTATVFAAAPKLVDAIQNGNAEELLSAVGEIGAGFAKLQPNAAASFAKDNPRLANFFGSAGKLFARVKDAGVTLAADAVATARAIAPTLPRLDADAIALARELLGGPAFRPDGKLTLPSVAQQFFDAGQAAAGGALDQLASTVPWYAHGAFAFGATIAAAQAAQDESRQSVATARTGLVSVRYMLSNRTQLESPLLATLRVTHPALTKAQAAQASAPALLGASSGSSSAPFVAVAAGLAALFFL